MYANSAAIGVFDSGMGGLTVLSALQSRLPMESFIYLGDTARLPYGTKSAATVQQYAVQMAKLLVERRIKALVIACNTATTAALHYLQKVLTDLPVIGVVAPGAASAAVATANQHIAVMATETTVASGAYQRYIQSVLPTAKITGHVCSLLVALAEEGMVANKLATVALEHYLQGIGDEDTILLGCTHFPVFKPLLRKLVANNIKIVDSAEATAQALENLLSEKQLLVIEKSPFTRYLVTDSVDRFQRVGEIFLQQELASCDVELIDCR
jgi:glutamate racemase